MLQLNYCRQDYIDLPKESLGKKNNFFFPFVVYKTEIISRHNKVCDLLAGGTTDCGFHSILRWLELSLGMIMQVQWLFIKSPSETIKTREDGGETQTKIFIGKNKQERKKQNKRFELSPNR